ncbi:suppressor of fused domain protein [Duganella sp. sic0402]|uniref:suppressor of fused domain protein n=1 Tax=Duganella sp. sic0402 TaxID=2854786 RepID=UPI001C45CA94|nr:suppressor of fused domain protein [Duganella sp. sic0402]MBV7537887.1 suppressor of fused domain protein [Duganella sp. sic0402]
MEQNFEQDWLLALEQRFGVQGKIAQVALDGRPRMLVYYFEDFPATGMLTAVTAGLSNATHPSWVNGKPELSFTLHTRDAGWGSAAAYIAQSFFNDSAFHYQASFKLDQPMSKDSAMNACFVYRPQYMNDEQVKFELPDRTIFLAGLFPMYDEEVPLYETKGLMDFWNTPGFDPYNPRRASIATKD